MLLNDLALQLIAVLLSNTQNIQVPLAAMLVEGVLEALPLRFIGKKRGKLGFRFY